MRGAARDYRRFTLLMVALLSLFAALRYLSLPLDTNRAGLQRLRQDVAEPSRTDAAERPPIRADKGP